MFEGSGMWSGTGLAGLNAVPLKCVASGGGGELEAIARRGVKGIGVVTASARRKESQIVAV